MIPSAKTTKITLIVVNISAILISIILMVQYARNYITNQTPTSDIMNPTIQLVTSISFQLVVIIMVLLEHCISIETCLILSLGGSTFFIFLGGWLAAIFGIIEFGLLMVIMHGMIKPRPKSNSESSQPV